MLKEVERADQIVEAALRDAVILNDSQRSNVRKKIADLTEGRTVWESVPFRVILESNRSCNMRCVMCSNEHNNKDRLDPYLADKLYEAIGWGAMEMQPDGGSEPTLGPMNLLGPLVKKHNQYFNFVTNGILFTREFFENIADNTARIQFSLHSHRPEITASIVQGQDFELVTKNIKDAVRISERTGTQTLTSSVTMNQNFDGMVDYVHFMADLGVKRVIFQKLFPNSKNYARDGLENHRGPSEIRDMCSRALEAALERGVYLESNFEVLVRDPRNKPTLKSPFDFLHENAHLIELYRPDYCISTSHTIFVYLDGTVLPCYQDRIVLGNLYEQSFDEIWNGDAMQRHRESFFSRELTDHCSSCQAFFCEHA